MLNASTKIDPMATTHLRRLEIEAFKSFEKKASVELPSAGLVLIRGTRDDGISSGTGKTTLLNAITHALKYCPEAGTEIQSWHTDKPARVELELEQDGIHATVARGTKSFVEFVDDGVGGRGSSRVTGAAAIDQHLEKYVGLPPELLAALTYRQQKSPGLFLSKSDSDKKSFLSLILGLTSLEDEVEAAQDRIKVLEKELVALEAKRDAKSAQLQQEIAKAPSTDMADVEGLENALVAIRGEREAADKNYRDAKTELNDFLASVQKRVSELNAEANTDLAKLNAELSELERNRPVFAPDRTKSGQLSNTYCQVSDRIRLRKIDEEAAKKELRSKRDALNVEIFARGKEAQKLPKLQDKITELRRQQADSKCPTCKQEWVKSNVDFNSFNDQIALIEAEISMISDKALEVQMLVGESKRLEDAIAAPDPLTAKMEEIKADVMSQLSAAESEIKVAEANFYADYNKAISEKKATISSDRVKWLEIVSGYQQRQKISEQKLRSVVEFFASDVNAVNGRISDMEGRINTARAMNRMRLDAIQAHDNSVKALQTALEAARSDVAAKGGEIAAERDFVKLVGREGFLGNIFSEVLVEIATEANKILKNVPNVAHVTVRFKNENVTQKGSVKKAITPVVSIGGVERPLGAALSGGMRTVVDLSVDLAARRVVTRRSSHNPAWLILDECMEGLSAVEKECIMHILKQFANDTLILVVDHASEFKELFDKVIEVTQTGGKSAIK
jgi:ABC-type lipoprotein export system ATPase subunit